jgi:hypothetical protein
MKFFLCLVLTTTEAALTGTAIALIVVASAVGVGLVGFGGKKGFDYLKLNFEK